MNRLRSLHLLVVAALLVAVTSFAACGGGDESGGDPQTVIDEATLQGIDSGTIDLSLDVNASGKKGGDLDLSVAGAFQSKGKGEVPLLDVTAKFDAALKDRQIKFDGGLVLLSNSGYVTYEGVEYEIDPTTFEFFEGTIKQQQREAGAAGGSEEAAACQEAVGELQVGSFIEGARSESDADVGGTSTTKVSGDLDVSGALDALVEVAESPACSGQLAAVGELLSEQEIDKAKGEVEDGVKIAKVDIYVGEDDIVRRIVAKLTIEPEGKSDAPSRVEVDLDLKLTEVNEEPEITAPEGKVKPLSDLFIELGVNPIELLGLLQGEGEGEGLSELFEGLEEQGGKGESLGELFEGLGEGAR